jgi:hypothetical protein
MTIKHTTTEEFLYRLIENFISFEVIYNASVFTACLYDLFKKNLKRLFFYKFFDELLTSYTFKMVSRIGKIN